MEKKTAEAAAMPDIPRIQFTASEGSRLETKLKNAEDELKQVKVDVESVIEMVDSLHANAFRDNLVRNEVILGGLLMISRRLRMALGDL